MADANSSPRPYRIKDITHKRFGRLIVSGLDRVENKKTYWKCLCDCGRMIVVSKAHLLNNTKSCGCLRRDTITKHGQARDDAVTPEYKAWRAAKDRCFNPGNKKYPSYGGRGITMCEEWRNNFEAFFAHIGKRADGLSLDRIENNGNYEPGNVRWASDKEQRNNQRKIRLVKVGDRSLTITQWSEISGIHPETIRGRLKAGWPPEAAVSTPV